MAPVLFDAETPLEVLLGHVGGQLAVKEEALPFHVGHGLRHFNQQPLGHQEPVEGLVLDEVREMALLVLLLGGCPEPYRL